MHLGKIRHAAKIVKLDFQINTPSDILRTQFYDPSGCHYDYTVGVEELGHLEMIGAIVHQLTRNLKDSQIQDSAFAPYFVDHTTGVYPTAASGAPWTAASMQVKGDPIADLTEDLAAEAAP